MIIFASTEKDSPLLLSKYTLNFLEVEKQKYFLYYKVESKNTFFITKWRA